MIGHGLGPGGSGSFEELALFEPEYFFRARARKVIKIKRPDSKDMPVIVSSWTMRQRDLQVEE